MGPVPSLPPGWHATARDYYMAMAKTSAILMRSIARGLNLDEKTFDEAFEGGISTLRFIHYPVRPERSFDGGLNITENVDTSRDGLMPIPDS